MSTTELTRSRPVHRVILHSYFKAESVMDGKFVSRPPSATLSASERLIVSELPAAAGFGSSVGVRTGRSDELQCDVIGLDDSVSTSFDRVLSSRVSRGSVGEWSNHTGAALLFLLKLDLLVYCESIALDHAATEAGVCDANSEFVCSETGLGCFHLMIPYSYVLTQSYPLWWPNGQSEVVTLEIEWTADVVKIEVRITVMCTKETNTGRTREGTRTHMSNICVSLSPGKRYSLLQFEGYHKLYQGEFSRYERTMGSCCSGGDKVEPLAGKTELDSTATSKFVEDVEKNKNRSCTDIFFLILLFGFIVSLGCLIAYCGINGDPYRIINGYDKCGNICGRKNPRADANKFPCYGEDQTKKKLLLVTEAEKILFNYQNVNRECVEKCSTGYRKYLNRCVPEITSSTKNTVVSKTGIKDFFQEASEDINMSWKEILYLCIIAMTFCIVILILFRFLAGVMVWLVLVGVVIASIAGTIYLWITWKKKKEAFSGSQVNEEVNQRTVITYLVAAIIATIITVIVLLVILVMRKRIALVITLFKEAGKAIQNMPFLLFEPFLVTRWYNLFGLFWFTQFIMGCQHMVIAGAVSKWFFTRNKSSLDSPILKSFKNLVRYHLGTVAMGSLLIALVQMVRVVLTFVQNRLKGYDNSVTRCLFKCCQCCLYLLEKFLKFFTRNAYIQTGLDDVARILMFLKYILLASAAVDLMANTSWSSFTSLRDVVEVPPSTLCCSRMGIM
uniref:Choline transporter-like protein n=1 Tax=Timema shepardi TaxID=629360 RepID=A0A7R9ALP0_TIMSH|nr:unnamed protein product [Timema shepardi]